MKLHNYIDVIKSRHGFSRKTGFYFQIGVNRKLTFWRGMLFLHIYTGIKPHVHVQILHNNHS